MPSCNTYHLTWVSLTLDMGYLFTAAPAKRSCCSLPWTRGISLPPPTSKVRETQVRRLGVARGHQRADTLKTYSQETRQSNHTRTTALSNSMKLSHAPGATQDRRVMVERSDRMWSTGEGNGKPLQYSCLENPMNSMKQEKVRH